MVEKNWGVKRVCLGCNARFYDFNKSPIVCPSCGLEYDPDYLSKRKSRPITDKSEDDIVIDDSMIVSIEEEDDMVGLADDDGEEEAGVAGSSVEDEGIVRE